MMVAGRTDMYFQKLGQGSRMARAHWLARAMSDALVGYSGVVLMLQVDIATQDSETDEVGRHIGLSDLQFSGGHQHQIFVMCRGSVRTVALYMV